MVAMVESGSEPAAHGNGSGAGVSGLVSPQVIFCSTAHRDTSMCIESVVSTEL
jgi:hypothetical protein